MTEPPPETRLSLPEGGVLHDPDSGMAWTLDMFAPAWWEGRGRVVEQAVGGRGTVIFVRGEADDWALRHYRRGGLVGRVLEDHFLWLGADRTRSFREWRLLAKLYALGLPVPRPIAAGFRREGPVYTADLITRRIPGAEPLSARVARGPLEEATWRALGACVRRFHDAGVCHADLTAHNLLLDAEDRPWLLDFDRGRMRPPGRWRQDNLERFLRSLKKILAADPGLYVGPAGWEALLEGYRSRPA